jgi:hypothetical protein
MRIRILIVLLLMSAAGAAQGVNGYVFFAPGGATSCGHTLTTFNFGAGIDAPLWKGFGPNVEIGALGPKEGFSDQVLGVFSPGATYHFRHTREEKLDPFLAGGYSLMFRSGTENLGFAAGGVTYWATNRVGLRLELRDHIHGGYRTTHFWGVRFGLGFR